MAAQLTFVNKFVDTWGFFSLMYNCVHIDKKWFYLHADGRMRYILEDNNKENAAVIHKLHIPKVMVLAAVAWLRQFANGTSFDGKLGVWPFVHIVLAKNNSKNRPAGTPVVKGVSASCKTSWNMLLTKVLPAINARWPATDPNWRIII